ncbi:hypothetical protein F5Y18DRAFT_441180 [Xylariaceae sp. FL1019]|nr:hypothetical protein F5Y18DRAFT_441180 [Xylariaceae sp. FL1019]
MAREAGAKKVKVECSAPPATYYKIAIAASIDMDEVVFLSLEDLEAVCAELSPRAYQQFESGVFSGNYVTPVITGIWRTWHRLLASLSLLQITMIVHSSQLGNSVTRRLAGYEASDTSLPNVTRELL